MTLRLTLCKIHFAALHILMHIFLDAASYKYCDFSSLLHRSYLEVKDAPSSTRIRTTYTTALDTPTAFSIASVQHCKRAGITDARSRAHYLVIEPVANAAFPEPRRVLCLQVIVHGS